MTPRYKIYNKGGKYFLGVSNDKKYDLYYFLHGDTKFIYAILLIMWLS